MCVINFCCRTWKWIASNWTKVRDAMKNLPENAILSIDTINADHYVPTLLMNHNLLKVRHFFCFVPHVFFIYREICSSAG